MTREGRAGQQVQDARGAAQRTARGTVHALARHPALDRSLYPVLHPLAVILPLLSVWEHILRVYQVFESYVR